MQIKTLLFSSLLFIVIGCSSTTSEQHSTSIPNWYLVPPSDNAESIYGVGEALSVDQAKKMALRDISGKFSTKVTGYFMQSTSVLDDNIHSRTVNNIESQINNLELSNYDVIEGAQVGNNYYVLLKMSRAAQAKQIADKVEHYNREAASRMYDSNQDKLSWWLSQTKWLSNHSADAELYAAYLKYLNAESAIDKSWQTLSQQLNDIHRSICISIKDSTDQLKVASKLKPALLSGNHNIQIGKRCAYQLSSSTKIKNSFVFKKHIALITANLAITKGGKTITNSTITSNSSSVESSESATQLATSALITKIETQGIWSALGQEI